MHNVSYLYPSTWVKFRPSLCVDCTGECCRLPAEVTADDLVRLLLITSDEAAASLKKVARRLIKTGIVQSFRAKTALFTLAQNRQGDCIFLSKERRCTRYEDRPDVCRRFPTIGPRPQYCPYNAK